MQALGQLRYPKAVQALSDQLSYRQRGPDAMAALEGLAGIGHPTSVSVFEHLLTNPNADMRRSRPSKDWRASAIVSALPTLQQTGTERAIQPRAAGAALREREARSVDGSLQQLVASLGDSSQRLLVLRYLLDLGLPSLRSWPNRC